MLKIYFDWNVITHLKDDSDTSKDLLNVIREYHNYFIFPYSKAHLRDLNNGVKDCLGYKKDLAILSEICGTHLLEYSNETNSAYPYQCTPDECLEKNSDELYLFKSGFTETSFSTLFAKYGLDLSLITDSLAKIDVPHVDIPRMDICIKNGRDMFMTITQLGERFAKDKNISKYIGQYVKDNTTEQQFCDIKFAKVDTIFQRLDKTTIPTTGKSFVEIVRDSLVNQSDCNFFIALYLALNATGFRIDKKHDFRNIYSDAEHTYYASKCDVFVTNDSRLIEKAQAIYNYLGIQTKIKKTGELKEFMSENTKHEYDLPYLFEKIVLEYGRPSREEGDLVYYRQIPFPFFGLFNLCIKMDLVNSTAKPVVLRLILPQNGFVYYTELDLFFNCIEHLLNDKERVNFQKECREVFMSQNKERILNVNFKINFGDYTMQLMADPYSAVPLPMMVLWKGPAKETCL